jgi:hypothetical protein
MGFPRDLRIWVLGSASLLPTYGFLTDRLLQGFEILVHYFALAIASPWRYAPYELFVSSYLIFGDIGSWLSALFTTKTPVVP